MHNFGKYRIFVIIMLVFLIVFIPFLINVLFKIDFKCNLFVAEWTAGECLNYYGTVLSFVGTIVLSILALWQNYTIKIQAENHERYLDKMEMEKNKPCFFVERNLKHTNNKKLNIKICNISENLANRIYISDVIIYKANGDVFYERKESLEMDFLKSTESFLINLDNEELEEENMYMHMHMSFYDKFNRKYHLKIKGKFRNKDSNPVFEFLQMN